MAREPGPNDLVLFAAAAGSIEAVALIVWTWLRPPHPTAVMQWSAAAAVSPLVRHQFVRERSLAWLGHLGSRSLLGLAFVGPAAWPGWVVGALVAVELVLLAGLLVGHAAA